MWLEFDSCQQRHLPGLGMVAGDRSTGFRSVRTIFLLPRLRRCSHVLPCSFSVHRLGQHRDVEIKRLVISDTVEDRILALQDRKVGTWIAVLRARADDGHYSNSLLMEVLEKERVRNLAVSIFVWSVYLIYMCPGMTVRELANLFGLDVRGRRLQPRDDD